VGSLALAAALLLFFRNPQRRFEGAAEAILAPADGRVTLVDQVTDPEVGPGRFHRISTFLSVFDVHVQRTPAAGEVLASALRRGRKVAAYRPDAAGLNEQQTTVFRLPSGVHLGVRQIAGVLARRVVCHLEAGDRVERGQVMGLIKFGSRVDLLVPSSYLVLVRVGDRLRTGETPVAIPAPAASDPKPGAGA
jgi:phosphatidylserine decarboxylase